MYFFLNEAHLDMSLVLFYSSTTKTFQALFTYFLTGMLVFSHLRAMLTNPGYVKIPKTKIDFSSDLEKGADGKPKKKKV